jgi:hypothetical protein
LGKQDAEENTETFERSGGWKVDSVVVRSFLIYAFAKMKGNLIKGPYRSQRRNKRCIRSFGGKT